MSFGTPKVDTPAATVTAALEGAAKVKEKYEDGYNALERRAIGESGRSHRRFLARSSNVDVMAKTGRAKPDARTISSGALATAIGQNSVNVNAGKSAQDIIDKKRVMVSGTGIDKQTKTADILGTTSGLATGEAMSDAQNKAYVDNARASALFNVGQTAAAYPAMKDDFGDWYNREYDAGRVDASGPSINDRFRYLFSGG